MRLDPSTHDRQHRMGPRGGGRGPFGPGGPRGRGMRGEHEAPPAEGAAGWFAGRLPDDWFEGPPDIQVDRDEILVVGRVSAPEPAGDEAATSQAATAQAEAGRIARFRESTRDERMASPGRPSTATAARSPGAPRPVTPDRCSPACRCR